jgi:hypothetical protein
MNDTEDNSSNDADRKPAAKDSTPTPDGVHSTCAGLKRKSTSTRTGFVVSTRGQGIKREPSIKTETAPAPTDPSTDQVEASIPTETGIDGQNLNRTSTGTMRSKASKRTDLLYNRPSPPPQNIPTPPRPSPQAENIPAKKKSRVEVPLPTTTDEAAKKTAPPDISGGLPTPATPPPSTATVNVSTRRKRRRQTQRPPIEMSEPQQDDDDDYVDEGDLSGPTPPPDSTVNALISRRSSRRVIATSSTGTPIHPPCAAAVEASTRRKTRRHTELLSIETSEALLDDDANYVDGDLDLIGSSWGQRLSELADYRKVHGHCNVPRKYSENTQLGTWVGTQRYQYKLHREGKTSLMTHSRIQELESLGFDWDCLGATWENRLSQLVDYRKIHGHCNVPQRYSENTQLARWVNSQRNRYKLHREGKPWAMTLSRIQELESLGFEWAYSGPAWEDGLSQLADYRKIHGHCNVPHRYSENTQLGMWVTRQRHQYKLHIKGKKSQMTLSRIQELESLGFECVSTKA